MVSSDPKKLILVIGATGAQGLRVINALLAPSPDGTPSPYAVRAFTRNATSRRALLLKEKGAELTQGKFDISLTMLLIGVPTHKCSTLVVIRFR